MGDGVQEDLGEGVPMETWERHAYEGEYGEEVKQQALSERHEQGLSETVEVVL